MADKCFGIFTIIGGKELLLTNFSKFNYFVRKKIGKFMVAGAKEIIERSPVNSVYDLELELEIIRNSQALPYLVGTKNNRGACFIFTFEERPHNHLIILSRMILFSGPKETITQNFEYIGTELKCIKINEELDHIKNTMINNINLLLKRGEILDELVNKTEHLTEESKKFYKRSKKLNKKCCFLF